MSLKFGLSQKKTGPSARVAANATKKSAFDQEDSDEEVVKPGKDKTCKKAGLPLSQYGDLSSQRRHNKTVEKALDVDESIYDYDAAYDAMQAQAEERKAADKAKAEEGRAKYMDDLLAAAEVRRKDQLRAQEKLIQREREAEGNKFCDTEKFVTSAYKLQQEEFRQLEVEEKAKEEAEREQKNKLGGQIFFRNLINAQDRRHMDNVAAAAVLQKKGTVMPIAATTKKSDAQIAIEMNAKGANIVLTDDGDIADRRQLLSAGLNVALKPKATPSLSGRTQLVKVRSLAPANGLNPRAMRERQSRQVEAQMEQLLKRQADDGCIEQEARERAAKSTKTDTEVGSARDRYIARKKAAPQSVATGKTMGV